MIPVRIIWHHSADLQDSFQFKKINYYHMGQDFPQSSLGFYCGYHWVIEKNGELKQARLETEIGAHDAGENFDSIGICLAGNFNKESPTKEQQITAAKLVKDIMKRWNIPITQIEPHRKGDITDCPGSRLGDYWLVFNYLKSEVNWLNKLIAMWQLIKAK